MKSATAVVPCALSILIVGCAPLIQPVAGMQLDYYITEGRGYPPDWDFTEDGVRFVVYHDYEANAVTPRREGLCFVLIESKEGLVETVRRTGPCADRDAHDFRWVRLEDLGGDALVGWPRARVARSFGAPERGSIPRRPVGSRMRFTLLADSVVNLATLETWDTFCELTIDVDLETGLVVGSAVGGAICDRGWFVADDSTGDT